MAQRYSEWARQQVDRANRTLNPKARTDRLALAEYYLQLMEAELAAAKRLEAAEGSSQIQANTFPPRADKVRAIASPQRDLFTFECEECELIEVRGVRVA